MKNNFRCQKCHQLQFKWELKHDIISIEVKCYACNAFSSFHINISSLSAISDSKKEIKDT